MCIFLDDVFGIAYKPFKKPKNEYKTPARAFDDEIEFENDLKNSEILSKGAKPQLDSAAAADEFDFESDCPVVSPEEIKRVLEIQHQKQPQSDDPELMTTPVKSSSGNSSTGEVDSPPSGGSGDSAGRERESRGSPSNYNAYGDAKDALKAIVDIYGMGLGDQEIVIMNSNLSASGTPPKHDGSSLAAPGGSVVPGTGLMKKPTRRGSGSKLVRGKIERQTIAEEDEEEQERLEREEEERQAQLEAAESARKAELEAEWSSVGDNAVSTQRKAAEVRVCAHSA